MKKLVILLMLTLTMPLFAEVSTVPLTVERAESFIHALIYDRASLETYFDANDLALSNRLRIKYTDVDWKILIGHDIDAVTRERIQRNGLEYTIRIRKLEEPFSKIIFTTADSSFIQAFFFKNDKMISPFTYFTRSMYQFKRNGVTFYTSDPTLLSNYSMKVVSTFIRDASQEVSQFFEQKNQKEWLTYQDASWRHYYGLKYNPIMYILCKDTKEVERITGFNTLGLADLSMDAVITTSNSHFHELMHILMNFNLNPIPLYTHPLLQEGIATCMGGRNGKSAGVMVQTGSWLEKMAMIPMDTLFTYQAFHQQDASISYPLSAFICRKYIDEYGMKSFTRLYKKYSTDEEAIKNLRIDPFDLHLDMLLARKAEGADSINIISMTDPSRGQFELKSNQKPYMESANLTIWTNRSDFRSHTYWKVQGFGTFLSKADDPDVYSANGHKGYKSRLFMDKVRGRSYHYQHYLLHINDHEIALYDLYLDQLIAYYNNEFIEEQQQIRVKDGKVTFYMDFGDKRFDFRLDQ